MPTALVESAAELKAEILKITVQPGLTAVTASADLSIAVSDAPGVDGPAALFEFDDSLPVAYLEGWGSGRVIKDQREVAVIATALSVIKGCALSPIDSAQLMTQIRSEL